MCIGRSDHRSHRSHHVLDDAWVSSHWSAGDERALVLSETLHENLKGGKNMMTSVAAACEAAKNNREITRLSYVFYSDPYAKMVKEECDSKEAV